MKNFLIATAMVLVAMTAANADRPDPYVCHPKANVVVRVSPSDMAEVVETLPNDRDITMYRNGTSNDNQWVWITGEGWLSGWARKSSLACVS